MRCRSAGRPGHRPWTEERARTAPQSVRNRRGAPHGRDRRAFPRAPRTAARIAATRVVMNTPLRIVIVDDESLARAVVREYATAEADVEIVAECANGFDAVKVVAEQKP